MTRTPGEVARAHIEAVESGDVVAMAADYSSDAVLVRGSDKFAGHDAIVGYFATVPARLGDVRVVFDSLRVDGDHAEFEWHLTPSEPAIAGRDVCRILNGFIVHQVVHLRATDF